MRLAHLVKTPALSRPAHIASLQLVVDSNVQIPPVLLAGLAVESADDLLAGLDGQDVLEVEDGLLPVCVLGVWACGELDWLVAGGKLDVEPGDQGVHVVGAADGELVWEAEGEILHLDGVEVEGDNREWVGDDGLHLDGVDEWLGQGGVLEWGVIEAPDVVPD